MINILKRYSDKKIERVMKSSVFLFSAAIWLHLAHSWLSLNYMCKAKCKTLENKQIHFNYFSITTISSFFKRFIFRACFIRLGCYMHVSEFSWK